MGGPFDGGTRRFTYYSSDGEGFRTSSGSSIGPGGPRGASGAQVLLVTAGGLPPRNAQGPITTPMHVRLADLMLETVETVATTTNTMVAIPTTTPENVG